MSDELFFPSLTRRDQYPVKKNTEYYSYSEYRKEIREDCLRRCVYCDIHENECGGEESMHLDHFRPKKYEEHAHLINDPRNLVWCCPGCNRLKSDDWPALGHSCTVLGETGYLDPFIENRREYFEVQPDGEIRALKPPAKYILVRLVLNRATRKRVRELRHLRYRWLQSFDQTINEFLGLLSHPELPENLKEELETLLQQFQTLRSEQANLLYADLY